MKQCRERTLPMSILADRCKATSIRAVKSIRLPLIVEQFGSNAIPPDVHVVYIVRAPWMIFRSQLRLGWLKRTDVPHGQDFGTFHANRICAEILFTHTHVSSNLKMLHIIKFENLIGNIEKEIDKLMSFLGVTISSELRKQMAAKRQDVVNVSRGDRQDIDPEDAFEIVSKQESCQRVMRLFNYLSFESGELASQEAV